MILDNCCVYCHSIVVCVFFCVHQTTTLPPVICSPLSASSYSGFELTAVSWRRIPSFKQVIIQIVFIIWQVDFLFGIHGKMTLKSFSIAQVLKNVIMYLGVKRCLSSRN